MRGCCVRQEGRGGLRLLCLVSSCHASSCRARLPAGVQWDDTCIADGTPGIATLSIRAMIKKDWVYRPGSDQHAEVPYGYLTGMDL